MSEIRPGFGYRVVAAEHRGAVAKAMMQTGQKSPV